MIAIGEELCFFVGEINDEFNNLEVNTSSSIKKTSDLMKKHLLLWIACMAIIHTSYAQGNRESVFKFFPGWGIKTNLLYDAGTTFSLGAEFRLSPYLTLDVSGTYNPWTFSNNKKFKHVSVQPELRYWIYEPFNGHFLGANLLYASYNVGGVKMPLGIFPDLKDYRFEGDGYGVGFSYGYQWLLSSRWNLEATFGFGYVYLDHTRYECRTCGEKVGHETKHYFGPTKAGISLIYVIK